MIAAKCLGFLTLATLNMMIFYSTTATACLCLKHPLQEKLVEAEYVDLVKVLDKSTRPDGQVENMVRVIFNYKLPTAGVKKNKGIFTLITPCVDDSRTIYLEKGKYYIVAAKGFEVNLCNFVVELRSQTREHMEEINLMYRNQLKDNNPK